MDPANFPQGVEVITFTGREGRVLRVQSADGERGLNLLLTDKAVRMYGEGPTVALVLGRLRGAAGDGLPPARAPGVHMRQVFGGTEGISDEGRHPHLIAPTSSLSPHYFPNTSLRAARAAQYPHIP